MKVRPADPDTSMPDLGSSQVTAADASKAQRLKPILVKRRRCQKPVRALTRALNFPMPVARVPADDRRSYDVSERGLTVLDVKVDRRAQKAQLQVGLGLLAAIGTNTPKRCDPGDDTKVQQSAGVEADRQSVSERDEVCGVTLVIVRERLDICARRLLQRPWRVDRLARPGPQRRLTAETVRAGI